MLTKPQILKKLNEAIDKVFADEHPCNQPYFHVFSADDVKLDGSFSLRQLNEICQAMQEAQHEEFTLNNPAYQLAKPV